MSSSNNQFDDPLSQQEISSIKPDLGTLGQKEKQVPRFTYSTAEYDSYIKNGFGAPLLQDRSDKWEVRFLNQVDLTKCRNNKIQVKILNLQRTRAIDYSSPKEEKKEFLVYSCDWLGANWLGNEIAVRGHIEGKYKELTRQLLTRMDSETGRVNAYYVKGPVRSVHTLPFTKKAVDRILNDPNPFGADSQSITDIDSVMFYGKFDGERGLANFRCTGYTYDQFIVPEWKRFVELATRRGGPAAILTNAEQEGYIK